MREMSQLPSLRVFKELMTDHYPNTPLKTGQILEFISTNLQGPSVFSESSILKSIENKEDTDEKPRADEPLQQ